MISGHLDVSKEEFEKHYREKIDQGIARGDAFVVGDSRGGDSLGQQYLAKKGVKNVVIYHLHQRPFSNFGNWQTRGQFTNHTQKDAAMTRDSTYDIAWVRDPERSSGTRRNLERRQKFQAPRK